MDDRLSPEQSPKCSHIKHLLIIAGLLSFVLVVLVSTRRVEVGPGVQANLPAPPRSAEAAVETECPRPSIKAENGDCVLTEDVTIGRTLALGSSTILDCQGHKLSAKTLGSGSTADTYEASVPELAILLNGTIGTTVKNCTLEGFDFGVMIIKSKIPEELKDDESALALRRNKILSNIITTRAAGVLVFGADNNEISGNTIEYTSGGSKGAIHLFRDSDKNLVNGNIIRGAKTPNEFTHYSPGFSQPFFCKDCAVLVSNPTDFALINLIIDHTLVAQFPNAVDQLNNDNTIEGNNITHFGSSAGKQHRGITIAVRSVDTTVRNNTVTGGRTGIAGTGYQDDVTAVFPTTCTLDPVRFCATNDDCFISGVDTESKGICKGTRTGIVDGSVPGSTIENNTLNGPFNLAAMTLENVDGIIVQNNSINGTGSEIGIEMSFAASQEGIVRRNVISGTRIGLVLTGYESHPYGAQISLNDIRGSTFRAIDSYFGAPGAVELSAGHCAQDSSISCSSDKQCVDQGRGQCVNMRGNFWGRTCADSDGFREFGQTAADSPKKTIVDSHPYGESVATWSDGPLPATCL